MERSLAVLELRHEHETAVELARVLARTIDGLDARERAARLPALVASLDRTMAALSVAARPGVPDAPPTKVQAALAGLRAMESQRARAGEVDQ